MAHKFEIGFVPFIENNLKFNKVDILVPSVIVLQVGVLFRVQTNRWGVGEYKVEFGKLFLYIGSDSNCLWLLGAAVSVT